MHFNHDLTISVPQKFGEQTELGIFESVSWFLWSDKLECTYFYQTGNKWNRYMFVDESDSKIAMGEKYQNRFVIPKKYMENFFLWNLGFPLKGRGIVCGIGAKNGQFFAEIMLTDLYNQHIKVECTEDFTYINGKIYVPPSWDTEEKRNSILYKEYVGKVGFGTL